MADQSIFNLLGKVDNLQDPIPLLNERPAILGFTITFLVRRTTPPPDLSTARADHIPM